MLVEKAAIKPRERVKRSKKERVTIKGERGKKKGTAFIL
jgi:hypothetical protein